MARDDETVLRIGDRGELSTGRHHGRADETVLRSGDRGEPAPADPGLLTGPLTGLRIGAADETVIRTGDRGDASATARAPVDPTDDTVARTGHRSLAAALTVASGPPPELPVIDRGVYAIVSTLGQGGLGRVLRAVDRRLGREVALKELLRADLESDVRFVREALVTARLQHPGIVPVYEAGRGSDGEPFYAMKLVGGRPLGAAIDACETVEQRLALLPKLLDVAEAVAYAHHEGVIHRDLKPGNVMLGDFGEVVVIDWGLAKGVAEEAAEAAEAAEEVAAEAVDPAGDDSLTMVGTVLGTPMYMPPEQALGGLVDARADVYSLGAILYHLLAGAPPYDERTPYGVLEAVRAGPPTPLPERVPGLSHDLLAIVAKAMARGPEARYADAAELADDLRRFTAGQLVRAHRYSAAQRLRRFVRRHLALLSVSGLALALVIAVGAYSLAAVLSARRVAESERDRARDERDQAEAARARAIANADALILAEARAHAPVRPSAAVAELARLSPGFQGLGEARVITAEAASIGLATVLRGHENGINNVRFSDDETRIATSSDDGTVRIWARDGRELQVLRGHTDEAWAIRFVPGDRQLVSCGKDRRVLLWDLRDGSYREVGRHDGPVFFGRVTADGRSVVSLDTGSVRLWDLEGGGARTLTLPGAVRGRGTLASDRDVLAVDVVGGMAVVDLGDLGDPPGANARLLPSTPDAIGRPGLSADGGVLAIASGEREVTAWTVADGVPRRITGLPAPIRALAISYPGDEVAIGDEVGVVRRYDTATMALKAELRGHEGAITNLLYSRDGLLASASSDRSARVWDPATGASRALQGFVDVTRHLDFTRDGEALVVSSYDGTAGIYPTRPRRDRALARLGRPLAGIWALTGDRALVRAVSGDLSLVTFPEGQVSSFGPAGLLAGDVAVSRDGSRVAVAGDPGVLVLDGEGAPLRALRGPEAPLVDVCLADRDRIVVAAGADGAVWAWAPGVDEGRLLGRHEGGVIRIGCAEAGPLAASGGRDHGGLLFDLERGEARRLDGGGEDVLAVAFSDDARRVVLGSRDHKVRILPVEGGGEPFTFEVGGAGVWQIAPIDGGARMIILQGSTSLRIWDPATGRRLASHPGHTSRVEQLVLAADGVRAATVALDGSLFLWDLKSGTSRRLGAGEPIAGVIFSRDGGRLVSAGRDGVVRLWHDDLPDDEAGLRAWWAEALRAAR
ncbi:MAG: protein kinase [Nannocystaceae bacterium]